MAAQNEFVDHLLDLLGPFGGVSARRMFGGTGLFRHGLMFGLVADETLYLKTDDVNRHEFEAEGLSPFYYSKKGKTVKIAYYEAPAVTLESSAEMMRWAESAFAAALRTDSKRGKE